MSERFRGFIAAPLPEAAREALAEAEDRLQRVAVRQNLTLKWCKPEELHVTLKFLGSISRSHLDTLSGALAKHASQNLRIEATLSGVGVFGSPRRARLLHVSVDDPAGGLSRLAEAFEAEAESLDVAREGRAFKPHITLARFKRPGDARALIEARALEPLAVRFDVIRLYESTPGPSGSRYRVLSEAPLETQ